MNIKLVEMKDKELWMNVDKHVTGDGFIKEEK